MSDKEFKEYYIGIFHNQHRGKLINRELKKVLDLFLPYQQELILKAAERKRIRGDNT
jgi:hypothetical protein